MFDHDATEGVEKALPLVGRQGLPELAGLPRTRPLGRARGGRQADRDRRMMALLADVGSRVCSTSPLTGAVRLPQS
jgi:hypothetical protein